MILRTTPIVHSNFKITIVIYTRFTRYICMRTHYGTFLQFYDYAWKFHCAFDHKWIVMFIALLFTLVWYQSVISSGGCEDVFAATKRTRTDNADASLEATRTSSGLLTPIKWRTEEWLVGSAGHAADMVPRQDITCIIFPRDGWVINDSDD